MIGNLAELSNWGEREDPADGIFRYVTEWIVGLEHSPFQPPARLVDIIDQHETVAADVQVERWSAFLPVAEVQGSDASWTSPVAALS